MAFDVCDCPDTPLNYWRLPSGDWVLGADPARYGIDNDNDVRAAVEDGTQFKSMGCIAFVIACPECGRIYESGGNQWGAVNRDQR